MTNDIAAEVTIAGLEAGLHVFCEKPLCLNHPELAEIAAAYEAALSESTVPPVLMVGFNRRFAPLAVRLKQFLAELREPLLLHYRVNAGFLSRDHWLNDPEQGGGRIIGEVCHFVDFLCFLTGSSPAEVETRTLPNAGQYSNDNVECSLRFADGSLGTITYLANGDPSFSKERLEVFGGGGVAVLEDFRRLQLVRHGKRHSFRTMFRQHKGHRAEWEAFADAVRRTNEPPIPFAEIVTSMRTTFALEESRCLGTKIAVPSEMNEAGKDYKIQPTVDFDQAS